MGVLTCGVAWLGDGDFEGGDPAVDTEIDEDVALEPELGRMRREGQRVGVDKRVITIVDLLAGLIVRAELACLREPVGMLEWTFSAGTGITRGGPLFTAVEVALQPAGVRLRESRCFEGREELSTGLGSVPVADDVARDHRRRRGRAAARHLRRAARRRGLLSRVRRGGTGHGVGTAGGGAWQPANANATANADIAAVKRAAAFGKDVVFMFAPLLNLVADRPGCVELTFPGGDIHAW